VTKWPSRMEEDNNHRTVMTATPVRIIRPEFRKMICKEMFRGKALV
jgi:hypothetical protein